MRLKRSEPWLATALQAMTIGHEEQLGQIVIALAVKTGQALNAFQPGIDRVGVTVQIARGLLHIHVRVGHGAMGDVFRAHDGVLEREVAVKVLAAGFAEDPEFRARFTREGLAAARM